MHFGMVTLLDRAADEARRSRNPQLFLARLSEIHPRWHMSVRQPGFLLFHWHAVRHAKSLGIIRMLNATPYTLNDFSPGGRFADANWDSDMGSLQPSKSLEDLAEYSFQIENWHGLAHGVIADVTNTPAMMDFERNVFLSIFWRLHGLINQKFEEQIRSYANSAHPTSRLRTPAAIVRHIQNEHHEIVGRI
ncbi:hypothetical protein BH18THE1_BH18THE1_01620 [soil metagenome]